jgi:hypothetical protein
MCSTQERETWMDMATVRHTTSTTTIARGLGSPNTCISLKKNCCNKAKEMRGIVGCSLVL